MLFEGQLGPIDVVSSHLAAGKMFDKVIKAYCVYAPIYGLLTDRPIPFAYGCISSINMVQGWTRASPIKALHFRHISLPLVGMKPL